MMIKNRLRKTASKRLPEECRTKFKQALKSLFEHDLKSAVKFSTTLK